MNKIPLLLLLAAALTLGVAATTLAADTGRVYVDTMIGGTVDSDIGGLDGDAKETYIGFELPVDKFKLNLELLTGHWDPDGAGGDLDLKGYEVKGGYQVLNNKDLQVYVTLAGYNRKSDDGIEPEFSGVLLGADVNSNLTPKINVEGSLGYSLTGTYESAVSPDEDVSLLLFKAKLNYMITKNIYASAGYRYYGFDVDNLGDVKSKGITLGVGLKF